MSWVCWGSAEVPPIRHRDQRGAVTAELALGLPLLLAVTTGLVWLISVGVAQVRVVDAAREAARMVARGDDESEARRVAGRIAPPGSRVVVEVSGDQVVVRVTGRVEGPGGLFAHLSTAHPEATAVTVAEEAGP